MLKKIKIFDIGKVITGNTPPKNKPELYGNYTPFVKATDISENNKYTYETEEYYSKLGYEKYKQSLIPKGSTCVVTIGSIGKKMTMAHCDLFINQAMNAIIPNSNFDQQYVYYLLKNNLNRLKVLDSGTASGRENVSKSAFSNLELEIIENIDIQKKIGNILSAYDELIENNQKQIKLLEETAQRLYKEWFVDLHFPNYENTPIVDGVPEGWTDSILDNICYLSKNVLKPEQIPNECAYIGLEHMPRKSICLSDWGNSSDITSDKYQYIEDDILFGKIRPYFHKVGFALNNGVSSTDSIIMKTTKNMWCILLMTVSSTSFVNYASVTCKEGSKMPRADWEQMKQYKVLIPDRNTLEKFNQYVWTITRKIKILALSNKNLLESRDRLLPKLMRGELEV